MELNIRLDLLIWAKVRNLCEEPNESPVSALLSTESSRRERSTEDTVGKVFGKLSKIKEQIKYREQGHTSKGEWSKKWAANKSRDKSKGACMEGWEG